MSSRTVDLAILAIGVAAVSSAAILIREAEAPALVISAARTGLAALPLLVLTGLQRRRPERAGGMLLLSLASGAFLALHFGFWIASVQKTSIITSVVLVTTTPLFIGVVSGRLLSESPSRTLWLALAIAAVGALLMVSEDFSAGADTLTGDLFALVGAVFAGGYLLAGRRVLTNGGSWLRYTTVTYSTAALLLLATLFVAGQSLGGYSTRTYALLGLIALVPQLIGHTAINRTLGRMPAMVVAVAILGEPVGSTILAAVFLDELPTVLQVLGGLIVLAGVFLGIRAGVDSRSPVPGDGLL